MDPRTLFLARFNRQPASETAFPRVVASLLTLVCLVASASAGPLSVVETKLRPEPLSEAARADYFGAATAVDGDRMAIGVSNAHGCGSHQGAVDVYRRSRDGAWEREAVLIASDAQAHDEFGQALALAGDTLVVAALRPLDDPLEQALLLYAFARTESGWVEEASFVLFYGDWYSSYPISLAVHGDRFAAGVPDEDGLAGEGQGAAYVFHRGIDGWELEARLTAEDAQEYAAFGTALALDGEQLIIGARWATSEPDDREGVAYVFELIDGAWMQTARIARPAGASIYGTFGEAVALHDGIAAVGHSSSFFGFCGGAHVYERGDGDWGYVTMLLPEPGDVWQSANRLALDGARLFLSATDDSDDLEEPTHAVFVFAQEAGDWTLQTRLDSPTGDDDQFGNALDFDGSSLCVGAPYHDGPSGREQGAAYVYSETEAGWSLDATLRRADGILSDCDYLGSSVAVQDDLLLAGATSDCDWAGPSQGSVYVYRLVDNEWQLSQKLLAPDAQAHDQFGSSVAISGERFVVGATGADTPVACDAGAAYVYRREGDDLILEARLSASDGVCGDRFGNAVAIDGDRVIVGAYYADRVDNDPMGAAYIFARVDGAWAQQARLVASDPLPGAYFGYSLALDGARAVVGAYGTVDAYCGAAYVFTESSGFWTEEARLAVDDAGLAIWFGLAVAIEGDTIAVGAPRVSESGGCGELGRVFVFSRIDGAWERQASLRPDAPMIPAQFGEKLALHAGRLAIGAGSECDGDMWNNGAVYLFHGSGDAWSQALRITASDTHSHQYLGGDAVALSGSHVIVGAPFDGNGTRRMPGAVYDFLVLCPGDVDGDWTIDLADLMALLSSYGMQSGASREDGDLDGDGDVDLSDLAELLGHYGTTCP